jgi:hypothetical protein
MTAEEKEISLEQSVTFALEEARTIVPGIQALFGFQLVAVFNQRFDNDLSGLEQQLHLAALLLTAVSCAFLMAPAAFHRRAEPRKISARLLAITSAFVRASLLPLMAAISLDVYLIARLITDSRPVSAAIGLGLLAVFALLWFVLPRPRKGGEQSAH